jgi:hypothetical protein
MLSCAVARTCSVAFVGPTGVRHSVEVVAETLFEAAGLAVSVFRQSGWTDNLALGTHLEVQVREPATTHTVTLAQVQSWCDGVAISPDEVLRRKKVKELIQPGVRGR